MRNVHFLVFIAFFSFCNIFSASTKAQGIELGVFLGASNYMGDLSNEGIILSQTGASAAIIGRYNLNPRFALKGFLGYGRISGTDVNSNTAIKKSRNLSFYSDIFEASAQVEFNLVRNSTNYSAKRKFIPYLFTGVGLFNFNPKAELGNNTYELQPLGTEGQGTTTYNDRTKYTLTQFCMPFGIGFKKYFGKRLMVGFELGARYTFTNYLDDIGGTFADSRVVGKANGPAAELLSDRSWEVSPDGNTVFRDGDPRSMKKINISDIYFLGGITLTYVLPNPGMKCPRF